MKRQLALTALWLGCATASGQTWNESTNGGGDAPPLVPGQAVTGSGLLTRIDGSIQGFAGGDDFADLYQIQITDTDNFSATTVALSGGGFLSDTQLWLFDAGGIGVSHNDNAPGLIIMSRLTSANVPSNGVYFLGVTGWNVDAMNAASQLIWYDIGTIPSPEVAPDGPGAPGPLSQWTPPSGAIGRYRVELTGASFLNGAPCPGDVDGDRDVDLTDLSILLANFGTPDGATREQGDLDGNGAVNLSDLSNLLGAFGTSC